MSKHTLWIKFANINKTATLLHKYLILIKGSSQQWIGVLSMWFIYLYEHLIYGSTSMWLNSNKTLKGQHIVFHYTNNRKVKRIFVYVFSWIEYSLFKPKCHCIFVLLIIMSIRKQPNITTDEHKRHVNYFFLVFVQS